jgi:hypothetical protein
LEEAKESIRALRRKRKKRHAPGVPHFEAAPLTTQCLIQKSRKFSGFAADIGLTAIIFE